MCRRFPRARRRRNGTVPRESPLGSSRQSKSCPCRQRTLRGCADVTQDRRARICGRAFDRGLKRRTSGICRDFSPNWHPRQAPRPVVASRLPQACRQAIRNKPFAGIYAPRETRTPTRDTPDKALNLASWVFLVSGVSGVSRLSAVAPNPGQAGRVETIWTLPRCCHGDGRLRDRRLPRPPF
jgi:hypothetical protein